MIILGTPDIINFTVHILVLQYEGYIYYLYYHLKTLNCIYRVIHIVHY